MLCWTCQNAAWSKTYTSLSFSFPKYIPREQWLPVHASAQVIHRQNLSFYHTALQSVFVLTTSLTAPSCMGGRLLFALRSILEAVTGFTGFLFFLEESITLVWFCAVRSRVLSACLSIMVLWVIIDKKNNVCGLGKWILWIN